jgi:hypothetical protein
VSRDPHDPKQAKDAAARAKLARGDLLRDIAKVARSPEGKRVVLHLLEHARMFEDAFSGQTNETMYQLGQKGYGLWLMGELGEADRKLPGILMATFFSQQEVEA